MFKSLYRVLYERRPNVIFMRVLFLIYSVLSYLSLISFPGYYSVVWNHISNEGGIQANPEGYIYWDLAMVLLGFFLPVYFIYFFNIYRKLSIKLSRRFLIMGLLACFSIIFTGLFPEDRGIYHEIPATVAFLSLYFSMKNQYWILRIRHTLYEDGGFLSFGIVLDNGSYYYNGDFWKFLRFLNLTTDCIFFCGIVFSRLEHISIMSSIYNLVKFHYSFLLFLFSFPFWEWLFFIALFSHIFLSYVFVPAHEDFILRWTHLFPKHDVFSTHSFLSRFSVRLKRILKKG